MPDNTRDFQNAYDAYVELTFCALMCAALDEIDPSTPMGEQPMGDMPMPDDLGPDPIDPATPVGDVYPRETFKQALVYLRAELNEIFRHLDPAAMALVQRHVQPPYSEAFKRDVIALTDRIMLSLLRTQKRKEEGRRLS
jgi:hypothetical protein